MGIVNGTFDTDLSGWTVWTIRSEDIVVWDNGTAKLWNSPYCDGLSTNLYQDFIIDNKILSFDWWSQGIKIYGAVAYSVSVFIEGGWTSVAGREFGWNSADPVSGTEYIDLSQYIGKTGRITFYLRTLGANYPCHLTMWVDNVALTPNWGTLRVSSIPGGADIYIDDSFVNITPETGSTDLTNISLGSHTVKITKTDYFDFITTVDVYPGKLYEISATLSPKAGCLSILSDPTGARIYLGDRNGQTLNDTGFTTFKQICNLFWGDYKWKLILPGYDPKSGIAHLTSAAGVSIAENLTLTGIGCIYFETYPPEAKIIVDNADTGLVTPNKVCNLSLGSHTYELALTGYQTVEGSVILTSTRGEAVSLDLTACTPYWQCESGQTGYETDGCGNRRENPACLAKGSIKFTSTPAGAEIFLDGADQGIKTPATLTDVPVGSHGYTLKLDGFNDSTGTVQVLENQIAEVSTSLTPGEGCIYFITSVPGAKIFVDDADTGQVTPALICGLSLGIHTYRLVLAGYYEAGGAIPLTPGQGATIIAPLNTIPKEGVGAGTILGLTLLGVGVLGAVVYASREKKYSPRGK